MNLNQLKPWIWRTVLVAFLVAAVWYLTHGIDFQLLTGVLSNSNVFILVATVPVMIVSHIVRAMRWQRLLTGTSNAIPLRAAFCSTMIGYAASIILPRSGEVLRPVLLSRYTPTPVGAAMSSIIVERVLDLVVLMVGLAGLAFAYQDNVIGAFPELSGAAIVTGLVTPIVMLLLLLVLVAYTKALPSLLVGCIAGRLPRAAVKLRSNLSAMKLGFRWLTEKDTWLPVLMLTGLMWFLYIIPLWMIGHAIPLSIQTPSMYDAAALLIIITIGIAVAPTPGAIGVYHGFAQIALVRLFGTTAEEGLAFALLAWALNYGTQLLTGGICLLVQRGQHTKP